MENEELLNLYLEKLRCMALEQMNAQHLSVLEALKLSLQFLEGEMTGY